ncbi:MAG: PHP domain-containing protein [Synergistaceae bacterium]|nr:PHP domain-containing protein [Synergistaceae bacterium]
MILIDMHVHSTSSDGTYAPEKLPLAAKHRHLSFVSLTDHDTTSGLPRFAAACHNVGIGGLCGIELSADADFTMHILGYRIKPGCKAFENKLEDIRMYRDKRNVEICDKLQKLGMDVTVEGAAKYSNGEVVARPHIAHMMIAKGYVSSIYEAFAKYIGAGGSAYVPRVRPSAEECIEMISGAGGLAVLAHPAQTRLADDKLEALLSRLKDAGLWGLEAIYSSHSPEQICKYLGMADKFGLCSTAGSDFHGANSPGTELGMPVSEDLLPWARLGVEI